MTGQATLGRVAQIYAKHCRDERVGVPKSVAEYVPEWVPQARPRAALGRLLTRAAMALGADWALPLRS